MSETADVPIVAATGSTATHYPDGHWVHAASVDELAERVISDLEVGMDPADWTDPDAEPDQARAGAIKAGASYHHRAAGAAAPRGRGDRSFRAGVPILVHTEIGTFAHEIVTILEGHGVAPDRIILATSTATPIPSSMPRSPTAG